MTGVEDWWDGGETVTLVIRGTPREIFVRREGSGSPLTILHGFPSSSHDWNKVAPALAEHHSLLMPDFLGFGASDKPAGHDYSIHEQADLVEELWARASVQSTALVAHDYAVSVAQELLARAGEGALGVEITGLTLLNGGVYPDLHRPQPVQTALLDEEQGPQISAMMNEELIVAGLAPTFAEGFDAAADSAAIWQAISRQNGQLISHRLIRYMADRERARGALGRRAREPRTSRSRSSGGCSTRCRARTWPSAFASACRTRRSPRSTTSPTGPSSRRPIGCWRPCARGCEPGARRGSVGRWRPLQQHSNAHRRSSAIARRSSIPMRAQAATCAGPRCRARSTSTPSRCRSRVPASCSNASSASPIGRARGGAFPEPGLLT